MDIGYLRISTANHASDLAINSMWRDARGKPSLWTLLIAPNIDVAPRAIGTLSKGDKIEFCGE